jgi:pimeloyl-ACP methyl ester carboxylesterase
VILIHGFSDIPGLTGSWTTVEALLRRMGVEYFTPQIPPWGDIEERSQSLIRQIAARYPGKTVHLFGHSMVGRLGLSVAIAHPAPSNWQGGINARDIASKAMLPPGIGFQIHTVTTFVRSLNLNTTVHITKFFSTGNAAPRGSNDRLRSFICRSVSQVTHV